MPVESDQQIVDSILNRVTDRTRLAVFSHITSATALILPVRKLCDALKNRGVAICVDGPHAPAHVPFNLNDLHCDFYTASCHKWLSAPFGTGFLYVRGAAKSKLKPLLTSWGRSLCGKPKHWKDPFLWQGTDNDAPLLTLPATLDFWNRIGVDTYRDYTFELASYVREQISKLFPLDPLAPATSEWFGSMVSIPIWEAPSTDKHIGKPDPLQQRLWEEHQIEIPLIQWNGLKLLRVSTHLYNDQAEVDLLVEALQAALR